MKKRNKKIFIINDKIMIVLPHNTYYKIVKKTKNKNPFTVLNEFLKNSVQEKKINIEEVYDIKTKKIWSLNDKDTTKKPESINLAKTGYEQKKDLSWFLYRNYPRHVTYLSGIYGLGLIVW